MQSTVVNAKKAQECGGPSNRSNLTAKITKKVPKAVVRAY